MVVAAFWPGDWQEDVGAKHWKVITPHLPLRDRRAGMQVGLRRSWAKEGMLAGPGALTLSHFVVGDGIKPLCIQMRVRVQALGVSYRIPPPLFLPLVPRRVLPPCQPA